MSGEHCVVWFNPACSKSRAVKALLDARRPGCAYRHYLDEPPSRAELERLLALLGLEDPRAITRTGDALYRELGLTDAPREAVLDAIVGHPMLLERPIVVVGDRAVVARPPERLLELLEEGSPPS